MTDGTDGWPPGYVEAMNAMATDAIERGVLVWDTVDGVVMYAATETWLLDNLPPGEPFPESQVLVHEADGVRVHLFLGEHSGSHPVDTVIRPATEA